MNPKKFFFIILGVIGALVLTGAAGYYFALTHIHATATRLSGQLGDQAAAQEQLDATARLKSQYARDIAPIRTMIDEALPRTKNQTEILSQLQRVASDVGLQISSVSFPSPTGLPTSTSQTVKAGEVLALPINFELQGSFTQLQTFLARVETLSRFTNVTTLSVSRADKTKPITYSMTVNAYVKP
jgi:Tfp pilus assembly protein PilO